jgi:hypothetical protein
MSFETKPAAINWDLSSKFSPVDSWWRSNFGTGGIQAPCRAPDAWLRAPGEVEEIAFSWGNSSSEQRLEEYAAS